MPQEVQDFYVRRADRQIQTSTAGVTAALETIIRDAQRALEVIREANNVSDDDAQRFHTPTSALRYADDTIKNAGNQIRLIQELYLKAEAADEMIRALKEIRREEDRG